MAAESCEQQRKPTAARRRKFSTLPDRCSALCCSHGIASMRPISPFRSFAAVRLKALATSLVANMQSPTCWLLRRSR